MAAGKKGDAWRSLLSRDRTDVDTIDRLAARVHSWRVEREQETIGVAVAARLRRARHLGRACLGLAGLMIALPVASETSGWIGQAANWVVRAGGLPSVAALLFMPLAQGVGGLAHVWMAQRLSPEVSWRPHLLPLGLWAAGFAGLMFAGVTRSRLPTPVATPPSQGGRMDKLVPTVQDTAEMLSGSPTAWSTNSPPRGTPLPASGPPPH